MKIEIAIDRSVVLPVPFKKAAPLLTDIETTIGRFPNLRKLTRLSDDTWLWEMKTMGVRVAKIAHDVSYAARYTHDAKRQRVSFEPVRGHGNALVSGHFALTEVAGGTEFSFSVRGTLDEVPVPLLYRPIAPKFISGKFTVLIERFLERTREALAS